MRLMFLSTVYPNRFEPTKGTFNHALAQALAVNNEVRVVAPIPWPVPLGLGRRTGSRAASPRSPRPVAVIHPTFYYPPKVLRHLYGSFLRRSLSRPLRETLSSFRPEAVIGYWAHPDGEAAVWAGREAGVPTILIVGGSDVLLLAKDARRGRAISRVLLSADAVLAVGSDLRRRVIELGVTPEKVHELARGVDTGLFRPGDRSEARRRLGLRVDGPLLLWVGHMVPVKGLDVLLDSCAQLRARSLDFRLCLVGDGPLRSRLLARAEALGLTERVTFIGPVAHHELGDWYRAADLTVLSSWSEGTPNVLLESLACGTPFVATRVGGVPDLGNATELVPPGDPGRLAEALAHGLRDPGSTDRTAKVRVSWSEAAASLVGVIRSVLPPHKATE